MQISGQPISANDLEWRPISGKNVIVPTGGNLGTNVRITGALVLDCGHGITYDCHEDDSNVIKDDMNQEIHPVYSIDVIQDFSLPRPFADLTGAWNGIYGETWYTCV